MQLEDARMTRINIGIDNNGVVCSPNAAFRGRGNDQIVWESPRNQFTLHFALISGKGIELAVQGESAIGVSKRKAFEGPWRQFRTEASAAYKYRSGRRHVPLDHHHRDK